MSIKRLKLVDYVDDILIQYSLLVISISGVGNVALQVSATSQVRKCFGVEKADIPAAYAAEMLKQFQFWMKFYGKPYAPVNVSFFSTQP